MTRFETDLIRCVRRRPRGGKEVMVTGSGGAKRNAGNRTLLDFNFVKKKKIMEESEDIYQSDEQVSVDKTLPLHVSFYLRNGKTSHNAFNTLTARWQYKSCFGSCV